MKSKIKQLQVETLRLSASEKLALPALLFIFTFLSFGSRSFAKIQIKGIYILEILFFTLIPILFEKIIVEKQWKTLIKRIEIKVLLVFFIYNITRFIYGIVSLNNENEVSRIFQHAIIFIYPFIWFTVGLVVFQIKLSEYFWSLAALSSGVSLLFFGYGDYALLNDYNQIGANLALGPIGILWVLVQILNQGFNVWNFFYLQCAFIPFWIRLNGHFQRTNFITLVFYISSVFLISKEEMRKKIRTYMYIVVSFILGTIIISQILMTQNKTDSETFKENLVHNDSKDNYAVQRIRGIENVIDKQFTFTNIVGGSRGFWWSKAIEDWKKSKLLGRGYTPEIPSEVIYGLPNNPKRFETQITMKPYEGRALSGPHNSYLTVLARSGVIGFILFITLIGLLIKNLYKYYLNIFDYKKSDDYIVLLTPIVFLGFSLIALGLESPHNNVFVWLAFGSVTQKLIENKI